MVQKSIETYIVMWFRNLRNAERFTTRKGSFICHQKTPKRVYKKQKQKHQTISYMERQEEHHYIWIQRLVQSVSGFDL